MSNKIRRIVPFDAIVVTTPYEQVYVDLDAIAAYLPVYERKSVEIIGDEGQCVGMGWRNRHSGYHLILQDTYSSMHIMVGTTDQNVAHLRSITSGEFVLPVAESEIFQ